MFILFSLIHLVKEINKIHKIPVWAFNPNAKAKYLGEFVLAMERPSTIANYAINIEMNNLNTDYYKNFLANINKVTIEDVQKAANKYFKLNKAQIVVTGKGSEIIEKLENINVFLYPEYPIKASINMEIPLRNQCLIRKLVVMLM